MFQLNLKIKIFAVLLALAILNSCGSPSGNGGADNNTPKIYKTDICKPNVKFNAGSRLIAKEFIRIARECGHIDEDQLIKEWENENNN